MDANYELTADSPCLDMGLDGTSEYFIYLRHDVTGNPRIVNERADMGAFESNHTLDPSNYTPWWQYDTTGSGFITFEDFAVLQLCYGDGDYATAATRLTTAHGFPCSYFDVVGTAGVVDSNDVEQFLKCLGIPGMLPPPDCFGPEITTTAPQSTMSSPMMAGMSMEGNGKTTTDEATPEEFEEEEIEDDYMAYYMCHGCENTFVLPDDAEPNLPTATSGAMSYFVTHGGTENSVVLPSTGGTVTVDVVLSTDVPIRCWTVWPSIDTPNVVSIDASNWTAKDEVLGWVAQFDTLPLGTPTPATLGSFYNSRYINWVVCDDQYRRLCQGPVQNATCVAQAIDTNDSQVYSGMRMSWLDGPMNIAALDFLDEEEVDGDGNYYVANGLLDAMVADGMAEAMTTGPKRVATLTLQVAGVSGTYQLWPTYASVYLADKNAPERRQEMQPGPVFTIVVEEPSEE